MIEVVSSIHRCRNLSREEVDNIYSCFHMFRRCKDHLTFQVFPFRMEIFKYITCIFAFSPMPFASEPGVAIGYLSHLLKTRRQALKPECIKVKEVAQITN